MRSLHIDRGYRAIVLKPARRLVERDWNGPPRVLGGAGTGKTVAAMHRRARYLARTLPEGRILFTTFTQTWRRTSSTTRVPSARRRRWNASK